MQVTHLSTKIIIISKKHFEQRSQGNAVKVNYNKLNSEEHDKYLRPIVYR